MAAKRRALRTRRAPDPRPTLKVVDLFAGAGGLAEGFRQAGYRVLAGSDIDPDAVTTFRLNFPEAEAIGGDVRSPAVREQVVAAARQADVICGGPPCQAFSQVRNHSRLIDDPRNSLYREFVHVVREALPKAFLMENVAGLDQMGVRNQMVLDLTLEGEYKLSAQVHDAADFGVPQTRKRLLFVGIHRSLGLEPPVISGTGATSSVTLARFPDRWRTRYQVAVQATALGDEIFEALQDPENAAVVTAAQAISDLAELPLGNREDELPYDRLGEPRSAYQRAMRNWDSNVLTNVQVPRINTDTALRLTRIPQGGNHRDLPAELLDRFISGQRWGQDNGSGRLSRRHFYAYRRLHPQIWAWTLNTKADAVYHYGVPRSLSVREFARLQSFPDRFIFTTDPTPGMLPGRIDGGPAHSRYRQVGNAVPPILARAAAQAVQAVIQKAAAQRQRTA
jgi:DNA (cytosine-5)-methyltransferase 1